MPKIQLEQVLSKLRYTVYPSVEGYWRADAAIAAYLDSTMPPVGTGREQCGPAALAALFGREHIEPVVATLSTPWINRRSMESCLRRIGAPFRKHPCEVPAQGLVLLQRIGLKEQRSFRGSFLVDTHWVAVVDDFVFDVNWPSWIPSSHWKGLVGEPLASQHGALDWKVVTGYEILVPLCCR